jgi:thioredoxin-like negative regulator of GroEL
MIKSLKFSKLKKMILEEQSHKQIEELFFDLTNLNLNKKKEEFRLYQKLYLLYKCNPTEQAENLEVKFWKDPSDMDLLYEYALLLHDRGDTVRAMNLLERISRSKYHRANDALNQYIKLSEISND